MAWLRRELELKLRVVAILAQGTSGADAVMQAFDVLFSLLLRRYSARSHV
jgi:hypothetical protein